MRKIALVAALCLPFTAQAQDLDRAIEDYNQERYEEAIAGFYEVLKYGEARGDRKDARYYMALSLLKKGLELCPGGTTGRSISRGGLPASWLSR